MLCWWKTMKRQATAMEAMPRRMTVRISHQDLYQYIVMLLLAEMVRLLDGFEEDLAEAEGRDVDIDSVAFAAELDDGFCVVAGEDGDLAAVHAGALDAVEIRWKRWRVVCKTEGDATVVFAYLLQRHVEHRPALIDHQNVVRDALDLGERIADDILMIDQGRSVLDMPLEQIRENYRRD